jgi:excisionase family DNA binding protein
MENKLYTIYEVAVILRVHHMTVRNWIGRGVLQIVRLPGVGIRITQEELDRITTPTPAKTEGG